MKEARLYQPLENGAVRCKTCAHQCRIPQGKRGICGVMENREGKLFTLVYGKAVAMHADPIEKKPLFHFLPGTMSFSVATVGCNMRCRNCQNSDISRMPIDQKRIAGEWVPPETLVESAHRAKCRSLSYTYTEPAIFWDYAFDTAGIAREKGLKNTFVTNGYFSRESLDAIAPRMDAVNVDLKTFRDGTYQKNCGARLRPVLDSIRRMKELGVWVEITTLLIPRLNDSDEELVDIAGFILDLDPDIPWHISRFYPTYRLTDHEPTPPESIKRARNIGRQAGLHFVYSGNLPGDEGENTNCWKCGNLLIERYGFQVVQNRIENGKCPKCGTEIKGIW